MARSVIIVIVLLVSISVSSFASFYYTKSTAEEFSARLDKAGCDAATLKEIAEEWDEKKQPLMLMINHRDIESISVSLIRAFKAAEDGRLDMAREECAVAEFMLKELVERERISAENIF